MNLPATLGLLLGFGVALGVTGCANVQGPLQTEVSHYASPLDAGPAAIARATKRGEACATNILGLVATGDASIDAAKRSAGITRVASVEQVTTRVLSLYAEYCTVVRGE